MTPTARSTRLLKNEGWLVANVEKRLTRVISKDLYGFVDLLCIRPGETLAVQTTDDTNFSKRRAKILASEHLAAVRAAGWRIECHGWKKRADALRRETL
ncbi:MAG: hypothetical protein WDO56_03925 [Gammaproteobacteria bacterium]